MERGPFGILSSTFTSSMTSSRSGCPHSPRGFAPLRPVHAGKPPAGRLLLRGGRAALIPRRFGFLLWRGSRGL
jgi:hypothetical protein